MEYTYETLADKNDYFLIWEFASSSVNSHFHKALELVYCLEGETEVFIDGKTYVIHQDEMYFADSYQIHYNSCSGNNKILSFIFAHNYFHDFIKTYPNLTLSPILDNKVFNLKIKEKLYNIYNLFKKYHYIYNEVPFIKFQAELDDLLFTLTENYPLQQKKQIKNNERVIEILKFINTHYQEEINLKTLAEKYHYSPKYFSNLFNKSMGCSINTYINNVRIENTLKEFNDQNNKRSLIQIALDNGFNSIPTFYRVLKNSNYKI